MLKATTLFKRIAMLSGNKCVYNFVHYLAECDGTGKCLLEDDEVVELKTNKVVITITKDTMTAINVYGTVFEDLTKPNCKLTVLNQKERVIYDKKVDNNKRNN